MPKTNRPPQVRARMEATKRLIEGHADEFDKLVDTVLAEWGWEAKEETVTRWVNRSGATASEGK